jgi:hypothetical protein
MPSLQTRLIVASALALILTLGAPQSSIAQRTKGDEGTGGAAGYSPPVDQPGAADAPAAPSTTAPAAQPADTGEPPPMPDTATPGDKKNDGAPPSDAPTGADIPD